jgi:N-acetylneuraminate synthase
MGTFIIAEIGINHDGSLQNCFKLIDAAARAGSDAVKFQMFSASRLYPKSAGKLHWQNSEKRYEYEIYDAVKRFETPSGWLRELIAYCKEKGILFLSSVSDTVNLDLLVNEGAKILKLPSYTITHIPLIQACAQSNLPILMSTGGATLAETEDAVNAVAKNHNNLKLLHCSIQYPTSLKDCNLGVMQTLKLAFPELEIGYSDHTMEVSDAAVQSIFLGGKLVEKHITLDKSLDGPDHFFALEPEEFKKMVKDIRRAEEVYNQGVYSIDPVIYGSSAKVCHSHEKYLRDFAYMTLFVRRNIKKGELIRTEDIVILRPGKKKRGLDPKFINLFSIYEIEAQKKLQSEETIDWDAILPQRPELN